ncbi:MAG: HAD-IA family hydrolase [Bacteroidetes bacterium]|nr:HAD-IA family hydrolase [Bacteroidota bacterium]
MPVRLLICDLDGTLVDSFRDIVTSCNLLLASLDAPPLADERIRPWIGRGVGYLVHGVLREAGLPADDDTAFVSQFRALYRQHALDETCPYPGVRESLRRITEDGGGLSIAILSNKPERATREILEALQLSTFFTLIAGGDSFEEMKPSPVPVLRIMEILGTPAAETAILGDSVYDLQAGKAAGVQTIAATYGFQPVEMLKALEPDYTVSAFGEVLNIPGILP